MKRLFSLLIISIIFCSILSASEKTSNNTYSVKFPVDSIEINLADEAFEPISLTPVVKGNGKKLKYPDIEYTIPDELAYVVKITKYKSETDSSIEFQKVRPSKADTICSYPYKCIVIATIIINEIRYTDTLMVTVYDDKSLYVPEPPVVTATLIRDRIDNSFGIDAIYHVLPDKTPALSYEFYGIHYFGIHDNGARYGLRWGCLALSSTREAILASPVLQGNLFFYADVKLSDKFILEAGIAGIGYHWEQYEGYKNFISLVESNSIGLTYNITDSWQINASGRINFELATTKENKDINGKFSLGIRFLP